MNKKLGTVEEFHSKKCFELYMYAVELANQVNSYIDNGYIVFDGDNRFNNKFIFYYHGKPGVAEKMGSCVASWFGNSFDKDGKIWLHGEETKTSIKKIFSKFKFVNPEDIKQIKFK